MKKQTWIMAGAALAAAAAVAGFVVLNGGKQESYRSIMVYQVNGSAAITRDKIGAMDAYENLMLLSGDIVEVAHESNMRLKLDDDKYLLAEQNTLMNIRAEGGGDDSKTYIDLQKGSVTSEIQNKLGSGASYEVNTPNSIMAVRGTIFRVALEPGPDGSLETKIAVFDGAVKVNPVLPDGTVLEAEAAVEAGKEITVGPEQIESGQLSEPVDIEYENLPPVMQEYLTELVQKEQVLPENVIQHIQEAQESGSWPQGGGESGSGGNKGSDSSSASDLNDANDGNGRNDAELKNDGAQADKQDEPALEQDKKQDAAQENRQNNQQEEVKNPDAEQAQPPVTDEQKAQEELQLQQQAEQLRQQEELLLQQQNKQQEGLPKDPEKPKQDPPQQNTNTGTENNSGGGSGGSSGGSSGGGSGNIITYYTVTFKYNGSVFGTQKVKSGEKAAAPKLTPTQNGEWNYNFSQKVSKNISIEWTAR